MVFSKRPSAIIDIDYKVAITCKNVYTTDGMDADTDAVTDTDTDTETYRHADTDRDVYVGAPRHCLRLNRLAAVALCFEEQSCFHFRK